LKSDLQTVKLKQKYGSEQVLVAKASDVETVPDGYSRNIKLSAACENAIWNSTLFVYRYDAEYNNAFIQLIPYVVVTNEKEDKLYVAERISGEERLRKSFQLGAGGHVNPCDIMGIDTILTAAMRETNEELNIVLKDNTGYERFGTVRDLSSSTSEHLGLVYLVRAKEVSVKEKNTLRGQWMNISDLVTNYEKFESWGRYIVDYLFQNHKTSNTLFI